MVGREKLVKDKRIHIEQKAAERKEEKKLVIQGSHMVSGTRCPARSDQLKKYRQMSRFQSMLEGPTFCQSTLAQASDTAL